MEWRTRSSRRPLQTTSLPLPEGSALDKFSAACARVLDTAEGKLVFDTLANLTTLGENQLEANRLAYREGWRAVVATVDTAAERARNGRTSTGTDRRHSARRGPTRRDDTTG